MPLWSFVWFQVWYAINNVFTYSLLCRWMYDRLPVGQWAPDFALGQIPPGYSVASTYPTDLSNVPERDAQNYVRAMAVFENIRSLILPYLSEGQLVWYDLFLLRPPDIPDAVSMRFDIYYYPAPDYLRVEIGQVISLPFALRAGVAVGRPSMFTYADWMLEESGVDDEVKSAVMEIRDGIRPWVYGNNLIPVPNDGHPGLLEIHRQLTGSEDLGVYHQPALRDMVNDGRWRCLRELVGRRVWVKLSVTGNRLGAGDSRLPHGNAEWVHNHYGQVRLRWQYPSDRGARFTEWRWIRVRDCVEVFTLPWVEGETPVVSPEFRRYGGLTVQASVLAGASTACDAADGE